MVKKLALIDADSLCYIVGNEETVESAISKVDERINFILEETKADFYCLFISKGKYFRHSIYPEYKGNRRGSAPKWMHTIKSYLQERYGAISTPNVEADDMISWLNSKDICITDSGLIDERSMLESALEMCIEDNMTPFTFESMDKVICAIDKDLLNLPGVHFNYTFKLEDKKNPESKLIKGWWVDTKDSNNRFFWKQMLMGDSSDGISGLPNIGEVKASKYLDGIIDVNSDTVTYQNWIFDTYINQYGEAQGICEFQKNYRLLHMLNCDEDFMREVGRVPEFPIINEVKSIKNEEVLF